MNWQVVAQLFSIFTILFAGPIVIFLVSFKKGNL
ncbi:unnamed protein product [Chrysoparadoxa australica]